MRFHVGPYTYRVRITPEPIVDDAGQPLLGKAVLHGREILIWAGVAAEQRLEILLHELKHCWLFHFPRPATEEESAAFHAAITEQWTTDLNEQGGVPALMRLRPPEPMPERFKLLGLPGPDEAAPTEPAALSPDVSPRTYVNPVETMARPHGGRAQCGVCEMVVAGGSIVTTPAKWHREVRGLVVGRSMFCPHCEHVQSWNEAADLYGRPNGAVVDGPIFERGDAVDAFLRKHPEATGIIVV